MHRAPEPPAETRLARLVPFLLGGAAVVLLLTIAASYRFAQTEPAEIDVAGQRLEAATTGVTTTPTTSVPTTTAPASTTTAPSPTTVATAPAQSEPRPPDRPRYGGVVTVGVVGELLSLNPFGIEGNTGPLTALNWAVGVGAIRLDPATLEPYPFAIEALPTVENGGLEILDTGELAVRYRIRDDAVWADGTPISAADFFQTYEVARRAPGVRSELRDQYSAIVPGSVTAEGNVVEYRLREVGLEYLKLFDLLVPAHEVAVAGFSSAWSDTMWQAGGPFRFFERNDEARTVRLVANQRSWLTSEDGADPLPYLDGVVLQYYPTQAEVIAALRAGDVQVAAVGSDPATLTGLAGDSSLHLDVQRGPGWEQIGFQLGSGRLNVNDRSLTGDPEVRRAIGALIDRSALAEAVQGPFGRPITSVVGLSWPAAAGDSWGERNEDAGASAAEMLAGVVSAAEAPPVISFATTANDPAREVFARQLVETFEELGFVVEVTRSEPGAYFLDRVIPGEFELAAWAWEASFGPYGAVSDLEDHYVVPWPTGTDFYRWRESDDAAFTAFAEALDRASGDVNLDTVAGSLTELEGRLAESVVFVPLYADLNAAAAADAIAGFRHSPLPGGEVAYVGEWWSLTTP